LHSKFAPSIFISWIKSPEPYYLSRSLIESPLIIDSVLSVILLREPAHRWIGWKGAIDGETAHRVRAATFDQSVWAWIDGQCVEKHFVPTVALLVLTSPISWHKICYNYQRYVEYWFYLISDGNLIRELSKMIIFSYWGNILWVNDLVFKIKTVFYWNYYMNYYQFCPSFSSTFLINFYAWLFANLTFCFNLKLS
jgi:hypothetical protein